MELVHIFIIEENLKGIHILVLGRIIIVMGKVSTHTQVEIYTKATLKMIKGLEKGYTLITVVTLKETYSRVII